MTTTDAEANVAPEVRLFLARVRRELADLDPEVVSDITDGLEADFTELVEDRGPDALGDPVEYAKELRAAAGIPVGVRAPRGFREQVDGFLDAGHARFDAAVARLGELLRTDLGPVVAWLRPLWWIVRAWAAVALVSAVFGLSMSSAPAVLLLIVAVAVSMFIGAGRVWPGGERGTLARVVLLVLNVFAAFVLFMTWATWGGGGADYDRGWSDGFNEAGGAYAAPIDEQAGVYSGGRWVNNIYPYDASGKPLTGVQLFDQEGKPIDVVTQPDCTSTSAAPLPPLAVDELDMAEVACTDEMTGEPLQPRIFYPWSNGAAQLYNVFPLPSRVQPETALDPNAFADGSEDAPAIQEPPLATVPKVSLPGVTTSSPSASASASPSASAGTADKP
ncbi:HAAS signaling domain-containing protein [Nocardioides sp. WG-D5]